MTDETLGNKSGQHKEWVSLEMIKKIEEREEKKNRLNTNRIRSSKEIHKEVKKSIRQDKEDTLTTSYNKQLQKKYERRV